MKIIIVSKCPTHPTTAGNRYWILSQAELLKQMGHDVHFLYVHERAFRKEHNQDGGRDSMQPYWKERYHQYDVPLYEKCYNVLLDKVRKYFCGHTWKCDDGYPHQLHKVINRLDTEYKFDCCIVNYYYLTKVFDRIRISKKALSTHDCFSFKSLVIGHPCEHSLTPNSEAKAMRRSPYIFALQDEEAVFFQRLSPYSKVYTVYGIYDFCPLPCVYNKNILFFSGGNEYNVEGLDWFLRAVFPIIVKTFPDVKLIVGGSICKQLEEYANHPNIQLYGFVDQPADFFKLGDVAINPTRLGTGLKIKTFESLSYGKVVMVHPHSVKGIYKKENAPLFVSDNPEEWNDFLMELWGDSNKILVEQYRNKDEVYINELKNYVIKQYEDFLANRT